MSINFRYSDSESSFYSTLLRHISQESAHINTLKDPVQPLFLGAYSESKLIGGIAAFAFYGSLIIDILWVDPAFRRQGIASQLLSQIENRAWAQKCTFITVSTMDFWQGSRAFYEKHGFQLEGKRSGYINHYSQLHFVKRLV